MRLPPQAGQFCPAGGERGLAMSQSSDFKVIGGGAQKEASGGAAVAAGAGAPHNFEAEQSVLGALLINNELYDRLNDFLEPWHFYDPVHGEIYKHLCSLIGEGHPASPVTLRPYFEGHEGMSRKGGADYLVRLAGSAATLINAEAYGRTIHSLAQRRELLRAGQDIYERAASVRLEDPPPRQIEAAEEALYRIAEKGRYEGGFQEFGGSLEEALEIASQAHAAKGRVSGLPTYLHDLDEKLGGLQPSDLIVIAGRPSMGKTGLAGNIAFNAARNWRGQKDKDGSVQTVSGAIVGFFSLEMSRAQLAMRLLADRAEVPAHHMRQGQTSEEEFQNIVRACQEINDIPLYIDQTGAIPLATLCARARRLKRRQGLDLMIVDYLQLVTSGGSRGGDRRVQEVSEVTQGLKALAKELNIPVIALSQLSRAVEARDDKRPHLADLRESGAIEQDADVVLFIYREEYYLQNAKPREDAEEFSRWKEAMESCEGLAKIIIGKQRHGPTGEVSLHFDSRYTRFRDLASDDRTPQSFY